MDRLIKRTFFFILFLFLFSACYDDGFHDWSYRYGSEINIYLVKDGQIDRSATDVNLNKIELEEIPWISGQEIAFYDWSAHSFFLNEEKPREKYAGRYFMVKANHEPLFMGYFFPPWMYSFPSFPSVIATDYFFSPADVVSIGGFGGFYDETMNENIKFKAALKKSGLLREGISVKLYGVKKKNSSTVTYTFQVTNVDKENIFVLDPLEMGAARFHYYTNGVSFAKGNSYYSPESIDFIPSENIPMEWYYRLSPGKSITRTVELGGFKDLPTGVFTCNFTFPGPRLQSMQSGEWKQRDGRIWLGDYHSRTETGF